MASWLMTSMTSMTTEAATPTVSWFGSVGPQGQAELIGNTLVALPAVIAIVVTAWVAIRQFRHERAEKRKDRAFEARKEVLLESVRGASRVIGSISMLPNMSQPVSSILESYQRASEQLVVSYAVASIDTVTKAREFINAAGPTFIDSLVKRKPLDDIKNEIDGIQLQLDHQMEENGTILRMQRDAVAEVTKEASAKVLDEMFKIGGTLFSEIAAQRLEAMNRLNAAQMVYSRENLERVAPLNKKFREYVASVRLDIELDEGNSEAFMKASHLDAAVPIAAFDKAVKEMTGEAD